MVPSPDFRAQLTERTRRLSQDWKQKSTAQKGRRLGSDSPGSTTLGNPDVRILLSNICPTVTTNCLQEIFSEFNLKTVLVNSDDHRKDVGNGTIVLPKNEAISLIQQFTGKLIGSTEMKFRLIAISNIEKRVRFSEGPEENESVRTSTKPKANEKAKEFLKKIDKYPTLEMAPIVDACNQRIEKIKRINHQDWEQKKSSQKDKSVGSDRSKPGNMMSASDIDNPVVIGSSDIQFKLIAASNIEKRVRFADKQDENGPAKRNPLRQHQKVRGFLKMNSNSLNPNILASTFTNLSI
ncbi:hypothetical protein GCK72_013335 [Caenorhabditis remanei]|uniref:RRM domain-containing protein n=1 Tax=Caenorhabditis remanei TaxID=31234 RepID=A0A6A5GQC9_CAERE|nr:hypothetical protein GCK72_013335 [Caenorhabditis remanei]KAF1756881.1 hypothetical protein GCK72_013335 [Caenorhabditis remanei]